MHRTFRRLLAHAEGASQFVIAVNLDIRGFSAFSRQVESPDSAVFIKKVYMKLIDDYFASASFFKPTGDGLLIIIPYTERTVAEVAARTVDICLRLLEDFSGFCANDAMVNFKVPKAVGIGLSRGTACCLASDATILDYSGRVLNLASRLMDLARPTGVVFDADFGLNLLQKEQRKKFVKETVFVRGIAEREPIEIFYTKGRTVISPVNKQPLEKINWRTITDEKTQREIENIGGNFIYRLESEPVDPKQIGIQISYASVVGGQTQKGIQTYRDLKAFKYSLDSGQAIVSVDFGKVAHILRADAVRPECSVQIQIRYPDR
jgi:class 3 adenylate cyclase